MSVVLTIATVIAVIVLVEGRINPRARAEVRSQVRVEYLKDWRSLLAGVAVPLGDPARPVQLAVFTDFECPFCRRLDSVLTQLEARNAGKLVRMLVHFPLNIHSNARPAAIAFECAAVQGRAREMHQALYDGQSQFGKASWADYGAKAGVADARAFDRCLVVKDTAQRIRAGLALAERLSLDGTPVVILNGWLFDPAIPQSIERAVDSIVLLRHTKP